MEPNWLWVLFGVATPFLVHIFFKIAGRAFRKGWRSADKEEVDLAIQQGRKRDGN